MWIWATAVNTADTEAFTRTHLGNSCQYPFDGDSDLEVIKKVQRGSFQFPDHVVVSEDAQDFVRKPICLGLLFLLSPPPPTVSPLPPASPSYSA